MSKELNKVRRKLESRRREIGETMRRKERSAPMLFTRHDEAREEPDMYVYQDQPKDSLAFKGQDFFILRALVAISLFLLIAIVFKTGIPQLEGARHFVKGAYEQEFQFAMIANWYEEQFGRPLTLVPINQEVALGDLEEEEAEHVYAVPASGKIAESFEQNGRGILVETNVGAAVETVKAGHVIFVGEGEDVTLGKMVVVQHYDGTESMYGMLDEIQVNIYDHLTTGRKIGTVSLMEEEERGVYYFALKEGDEYIDPNEVISFD
ncbi:M23 family metallopeptidase [Halalkalibacterium ligniniphilum]|uniref:M23 family metallopeptidase n=1 Tax=Halalkalibacterium ligniniphilum TaxID=1134413 RepID=UPI0003491279|nr:M23 family metallopeptidase [Halalkalibacterium ligniniphilum]